MKDGLRSITPLAQDSLRGVVPSVMTGKLPKFEWVDPKTIYVEEAYQRDILSNGVALVRKIFAGFSWSRFKPPVCVRLADSGSVLVCIDGQHTATAAASHPGIDKIPVMVVDAADVALRAGSFVGHNRDRLNLTPPAIYRAELAANDPLAVMIDRACRAAGARILPVSINTREKHPPGSTIAIGTIKAVARKHGEEFLARVLRLLTEVGRGPIKADEIAAAAMIMQRVKQLDDPAIDAALDGRLKAVIASKTTEAWAAIGAVAAASSGEPLPSAVASAWCREMGIRLPATALRGSRRASDATRLIESLAQPPKKKPKLAPVPVPVPEIAPLPKPPEPVQAPQSAAVVPQPQPADPNRYVRRSSIVVDLVASTVTCRNTKVGLDRDELAVVAALARVTPALLDFSHLERKLHGRVTADGPGRLRAIAEQLNRRLRTLEVRTVPKMGLVLAELEDVVA